MTLGYDALGIPVAGSIRITIASVMRIIASTSDAKTVPSHSVTDAFPAPRAACAMYTFDMPWPEEDVSGFVLKHVKEPRTFETLDAAVQK